MMQDLINKYNIPAPRYTSYPTVPFWQKEIPSMNEWFTCVKDKLDNSKEVSLYMHLPFCENLCTYCGCNKRITKNHNVEIKYIDSLLAEWQQYVELSKEPLIIKELHFGGGTPTFFSPENLAHLLSGIFENATQTEDGAYSFEAHPNNTTPDHLKTLSQFGFKRISIGVQDFSPHIMEVINRKQEEEDIVNLVKNARACGYTSVNFDLIFGLPFQTIENIDYNMKRVAEMRPERIAFYSYAHVPWVSPSQRAYSEKDLPVGKDKRDLYDYGFEMLSKAGYHEIGLDHFALEHDELYIAQQQGVLHRNFMGYTTFNTKLLIGLGCSAISDSGDMYIQNEKKVEPYEENVLNQQIPIIRGHHLSKSEEIMRFHITQLMCLGKTDWENEAHRCEELYQGLERLDDLENDGLITRSTYGLNVTEMGMPFIRNICMALDQHYNNTEKQENRFSKAV